MSTFDAYYARGLELYGQKKYKMSAEFFKIALSQSNAREFANYNLALAYQQMNNDTEALKYYEKFLKNYPKDKSGLYNTAAIYFNKQDYEHAANYFLESFKQAQDKDNVKALTKCYMKLGNIDKAADLIEYILNSDCDDKYAFEAAKLIESGYIISNPEVLDFALKVFMKLYGKNEQNFDVALEISLVYAKKGDWENAIKYCQKALEINPQSFEANNQMGLAYYCAEDMEKCFYYYNKAFEINHKTDYRIFSNLAYAYEKAGDIEKAIAMFKELIIKFQDFPTKNEIKEHVKLLLKENS